MLALQRVCTQSAASAYCCSEQLPFVLLAYRNDTLLRFYHSRHLFAITKFTPCFLSHRQQHPASKDAGYIAFQYMIVFHFYLRVIPISRLRIFLCTWQVRLPPLQASAPLRPPAALLQLPSALLLPPSALPPPPSALPPPCFLSGMY